MSASVPTKKPLAARCAEALGLVPCDAWLDCTHTQCYPNGKPPAFGDDSPKGWACTGPLVERYELALDKCDDERPWLAVDQTEKRYAFGPTPCAAIAEWVAANVIGGEVQSA